MKTMNSPDKKKPPVLAEMDDKIAALHSSREEIVARQKRKKEKEKKREKKREEEQERERAREKEREKEREREREREAAEKEQEKERSKEAASKDKGKVKVFPALNRYINPSSWIVVEGNNFSKETLKEA